jgi:hypothetical protein
MLGRAMLSPDWEHGLRLRTAPALLRAEFLAHSVLCNNGIDDKAVCCFCLDTGKCLLATCFHCQSQQRSPVLQHKPAQQLWQQPTATFTQRKDLLHHLRMQPMRPGWAQVTPGHTLLSQPTRSTHAQRRLSRSGRRDMI